MEYSMVRLRYRETKEAVDSSNGFGVDIGCWNDAVRPIQSGILDDKWKDCALQIEVSPISRRPLSRLTRNQFDESSTGMLGKDFSELPIRGGGGGGWARSQGKA